MGNLLVEHDKLISFLICSIDVEKSIGTTNRIFEWARIPERIEVFVKFDTEDYNQEQVENEFKKRVSYNDNVKLFFSPKGWGYCDLVKFSEDMVDQSSGEFVFLMNDWIESMTLHYDDLVEKYKGKLVWLTINEICDVDGSRQKWHELFDFPFLHRKWVEVTGKICYSNFPASDLYPLVKYFPEIVKSSGIDVVHFPGHSPKSDIGAERNPKTGGMCSLIDDEEYRHNKKVLHEGNILYQHEALKQIDIPRVKKFLELNPEYKV